MLSEKQHLRLLYGSRARSAVAPSRPTWGSRGRITVTWLLSEAWMLLKSRRPRTIELPRVAIRLALLFTTLAALGSWKAWNVGAITVADTVGS
jgi:hypothetical protein